MLIETQNSESFGGLFCIRLGEAKDEQTSEGEENYEIGLGCERPESRCRSCQPQNRQWAWDRRLDTQEAAPLEAAGIWVSLRLRVTPVFVGRDGQSENTEGCV